MWELSDLVAVEISEIKRRQNLGNATGWERTRKAQETYATITVYDKREDINAKPKVVNINNPFPAFLNRIRTDLSLWEIAKVPVTVEEEDKYGEIVIRKIHLTKVLLTLHNGSKAELTNSIDQQMKNYSLSNRLLRYSLDGGANWFGWDK